MANGPSAKKPKTAAAVAFCGVMSALSLLFLLLTAVPVTEISLAALAGLTAVPVVIEVGRRFGLLQYAAVAHVPPDAALRLGNGFYLRAKLRHEAQRH